jgi:hypothetical protein
MGLSLKREKKKHGGWSCKKKSKIYHKQNILQSKEWELDLKKN